ncbi:MAG: D-alanyl-D-alanine carboxypeptidase [Alcanivorax sp.]|nr:D-alanyl-D-alanine carboxypeptidase [Alcanivorax sp.]
MTPTALLSARPLQPVRALLVLISCLLPALASASLVPSAPQVEASGYILMDAASGQVIVEHNADERLPPASLTKIMTDYIAAREIHHGNIKMEDKVNISVKAWRMGGSRMFVREGTQVSVEDLIKGIIIQSGNDAAVAIAEHIAGSESAFADLMNQHARRLGMDNSHFTNSTGWPDENMYSSARDMAKLSLSLINDYPENYVLYREKSFTYNNITQQNRNLLLWRDPSVDGIKTGHTEAAGYCLVASAERDGMRLISVVMGTSSEQARARETQKLLNYGFRFFETYAAYEAGEALTPSRVWMGKTGDIELGLADDMVLTIPRGSHERLNAEMTVNSDIRAPIERGQRLGTVTISLDDEVLLEQPLVALADVERAGIFKRFWHSIVLFFTGLF